MFSYDDLKKEAIEETDFLVISLEKLLLMKVLGMKKEKYLKDVQYIADDILKKQYAEYDEKRVHIDALVREVKDIMYTPITQVCREGLLKRWKLSVKSEANSVS